MKRFVLTGGPCAGKTTARNYLQEKLSNYGYSMIFVPEQATRLIEVSGLKPGLLKPEQMIDFEEIILRMQMADEENLTAALKMKGGPNQLLICDRGCMDAAAYINRKDFNLILRRNNWTTVQLRDEPYDAVFHLVTAAEGRVEFYNFNNAARTEPPEQARALDARTQEAWLGHSHLRVIDNSTLFEEKMKRLLNEVRKALGIPVAVETERKFRIQDRYLDLEKIPVPFQKVEIEQVYLMEKDGLRTRLRKRSQQNEGELFYETKKFPTDSKISRIEVERQITSEEYAARVKVESDPNFDAIKKSRVCFLWKNQYFELDIFEEPARLQGLTLLEIELTEENDEVVVPDWLGKVEEVSENPNYYNQNLAQRP